MKDAMKDALMRRRGKGLDITIILGGKPGMDIGSEGAEDRKDSDLAPSIKKEAEQPELEEGMPPDADPIAEDQAEEAGAVDGDPALEKELMSHGEHQDPDLLARKPRTLGERMRQMAMMKHKK